MAKSTRTNWTRTAFAACAAGWWSCPAWAQDRPPAEPVLADEGLGGSSIGVEEEFALAPVRFPATLGEDRPITFIVNARADYQFETGLDTAGDFSVFRFHVGMGARIPIGERFTVGVAGVYDFAGYDYDAAAVFGGGEPWGDINTARLLADCSYAIDEQWSVFGGVVGAVAAESGADASDAMTGGGFIGGGYRLASDLDVRLGVSVTSQLEDDALVLPIFLLAWHIDDHWTLRAGALDTGASDTVGVGATYRIDDQWSLGGRLGFLRQRFRLDDSGFAPDGVGEDERLNVSFLATWQPLEQLEVGVLLGVAIAGSQSVENSSGVGLFNEDYDPAPFIGARLIWRF